VTLPAAVEPLAQVHDGLFALLIEQLAPIRGGDQEIPPNPAFPYWVLSSIVGGGTEDLTPLGDPETTVTYTFQADSVGRTRQQAQALGGKVVWTLLGRLGGKLYHSVPDLIGWSECARLREGSPGGVAREGVPPNAVYTASVRFTVTVTRA